MQGAELPGYQLCINQLTIVRPIPGSKRMYLSIARYLPNSGCDYGGIKPSAQRDSYSAVRLDLPPEGLEETVPQGFCMSVLVLMKNLNWNVPESRRVQPVEIHLEPRAGSDGVNSFQAGSARHDPFRRMDHLDGGAIRPGGYPGYSKEGLVLAGKDEAAIAQCEIKGCVPDPISRQNKAPVGAGDCQGELTGEQGESIGGGCSIQVEEQQSVVNGRCYRGRPSVLLGQIVSVIDCPIEGDRASSQALDPGAPSTHAESERRPDRPLGHTFAPVRQPLADGTYLSRVSITQDAV
jgi:hypothetical protein